MSHVCHITTAHPPLDTRIFRRECVSLAKAGYRVSLIARHENAGELDGVSLVPLPVNRGGTWGRRLVLPWRAANLAADLAADLYHFHDPELLPAMRGLARRTGKPVVWDAHEYYFESIAYNNSLRLRPLSRLAANWFSRLELASCRTRFAGVVTISEQMAKRYIPLGVPTCVSGNFPDLSVFPGPDSRRRSRVPLLASIGAQFGPKGAFEIADAFVQLRRHLDCRVAFWGTFHPPALKNELRARVAAAVNASSSIEIEGPIPWRVLVGDLLPQAWAGCVLFDTRNPNYRRGLPNRLFEMWAARVPVLTTEGTEVARIVREVGGGIVLIDNRPETLASAFATLSQDPTAVERMGAAGRQAVETKYNWQIAFDNLLGLYFSLGVQPRSADPIQREVFA